MSSVKFLAAKRIRGRSGQQYEIGDEMPWSELRTWANLAAYMDQRYVTMILEGEQLAPDVAAQVASGPMLHQLAPAAMAPAPEPELEALRMEPEPEPEPEPKRRRRRRRHED